MISILFEEIQSHMDLLDRALFSSAQIAKHAEEKDLDSVVNETENRERIMNVISSIQSNIENKINQLNAALLNPSDIDILKTWFNDLHIWSEKMISLDRLTVEQLSQQKDETTKEIAHLFKNKEIIKGYNHSIKK